MCYQVIELYSACRCPYYQRPIIRCASYNRPGHRVEPRTIDVGYACSNHVRGRLALEDRISQLRNDTTDHDDGTPVFIDSLSETNLSMLDGGRAGAVVDLFLRDLVNESEIQYLLPQLVRNTVSTKPAGLICFDLLNWYAVALRERSSSLLELKATELVQSSTHKLAWRIANLFEDEVQSTLDAETDQGIEEEEEEGEAEVVADENGELLALYNSLSDFYFKGQPIEELKISMKITIKTFEPCEKREGLLYNYVDNMYSSYQRSRLGTSTFRSKAKKRPGAERIEWTCNCGVSISDDYVELRTGALDDLRVFLANYGPAVSPAQLRPEHYPSAPSRGVQVGFGLKLRLLIYHGINWGFSFADPPKEQKFSNSTVPKCRASRLSNSSAPKHRFLLACVPFMKWGLKLEQPDVCGVYSDRDFFKLLKETYAQARRSDPSKWLRTVSGLNFARFEVFRNDIVDIRASPSMPSSEARKDYDYELPDVDPPIGPNIAMHFFENPDHADSLPVLFKRIPIKRNQRLAPCPEKGVADGWGVQFEESVSGFAVFLCAFVGFLLCLVTSILWTILRGDVQGGFGIGAFILAFSLFATTKIHLLAPGTKAAS